MNLNLLRQRVIQERDIAAQAALLDHKIDERWLDQSDFDAILSNVREIGLLALQLGRADIYEVCKEPDFLGWEESAVLLNKVAKMLEPPPPVKGYHEAMPLLVDAKQAASMCGISPASWHRYRAAGKTPKPVKLGGRVLFRVADLSEWIAQGCPEQ